MSNFVMNHSGQNALPELPTILSYDDAKKQLSEFNKEVVQGTLSFTDYFSTLGQNKEILKNYVTNTDQQSQSVQGLMRASQQAHDKQVSQNNAILQGTAAAKAGQIAMKGLALAGNILAPMLIGAAISHVAGWIDDIVHKSDKLIAKGNEAKEAISGISNKLESARKLISESSEAYSALASGIDSTTNKNVSLSTEEYEKYLDICSSLAETFPELIRGYDAEGNAMLSLGDNASETAEKLQELYKQKQLMANLDIAAKLPDVLAGYQEKVKKMKKEGEKLDADASRILNSQIEFTNHRISLSAPDSNDIINEVYNVMQSLDIDLSNAASYSLTDANGLISSSCLEGFSVTDEQLLEIKNSLSAGTEKIFSSYAADLDKIEKQKQALDAKKKAEWRSIVPTVLASLSTYEDYSGLSNEMQAKIAQIITGLDPTLLPLDAYGENIGDFIYLTFLQPFADPKTKDEVTRLFSELMKIDTSKVTEENKQQLTYIISELSRYLNLDELQLKASLGLDDYDTLYQNKETLKSKAMDTASGTANRHESFDQQGYNLFTGILNTINTQDEIALLTKYIEETNNLTSAVTKYAQVKAKASKIDLTASSMTAKLSDMEQHMEKLNSVYQEFSEYGREGISSDSLSGIIDAFSEVEGLDMDDFISTLYDSSSSASDVENAFQSLASQYLDSTGILNSLTEENKDLITVQLENMGFANASELVNQRLAASVNGLSVSEEVLKYQNFALSAASADMTAQNACASAAFLDQAVMSDYAKVALAELVAQELIFSSTTLDSSGKSEALYNLTDAYFGAAAAASFYNKVNGGLNSNYRLSPEEAFESIFNEYKEKAKTRFQDYPKQAPASSAKNAGAGASPAPTPQTYDWIEKKLSAIADQTDRAGKAFDKAFFLSSSRKKFHAYLSQISADLNANQTAAAVYQEKMNAVGLSDTWIDKIQNGSYSIEDISDETLKNQISEYENYYGKKKKCEEAITALEEKRAQAQKSYADKIIAAHDREISKLEKKISRRKALVSLKEVFGFSASGKDYKNQQSDSNSELSKLRKQDESLRKLQKTTAKGSEAWNAYQDQIKKNKEKTQELTQSIAELAVKMAELPTERLNKYLEKNKEKQELYEAKIAASGSTKNKNTWIGNQITLVKRNQNKTQSAAETTSKNLETSKSKFTAAKNKDKKKQPKSGKKQADNYYKKIQAYTKKNKEIPASLITKLTNAGMNQLAAAASNYNANLAANETAQAAAELAAQTSQKEISELAVKRFQNTKNSYEQKQTDISRRSEYISSSVSRSEAQGRPADRSYYDALISLEQQNQKSLTKERNKLQKTLNSLVASGKIQEFSEEWLEMTDSIYQVDQALLQSKETLLEYQNQLKQIDFDHFDYLQEQIGRLTQEADFYINVMSDKPLTNETGLTQHGTATLGLHYQKSEIYQNQAAQYGKEIDKLNKALSKDPTNTTLISQLQQYQDMQKECIQNAQNEKQAIADLVQQGYQSLIDSLGKSISKYKELLQNAKNAHEYQKNISQQTDNISVLKKQISAYSSMSDSEESSAKLQKLMKELEDAENNLDETMYDKYLSDTQDAMDSMLDNLEDFLSELSQDTDRLIQSGIEMITGSTDAISSTLFNLSEEYHTTLSSSMAASWGSYGSAAGGVDAIISSFQNLLAATDQKNDEQAFQDAAGIYQNYKSYNKDLSNAKKEKSFLKKKREKAKEQQEKAKKKLDKAKKKGKNSKEYKKAEKNWKAAKKEFDTLDKNYKDSGQKVNTLKAQQQAAKDSDKSTIQNFLSAIADKTPAKNSSSMDALDHAVLKITGGYITDANRKQILSLLGAANTNQAVNILKNLGLAQDAASGSSPAPSPSGKSPASGTAKKKKPSKKSKKKSSKSSKKKTSKKKNTSKSKKKSKDGRNSNPKTEPNNIKYIRLRNLMKDPSVNQQDKDQITRNQAADGLNFDDIFWNNQNHNHSMFSHLSLKDTILNQNPSRISDTGNLSIITGDLILPDVTDPSEFASGMVNALKNDPTVQRALGTLVNTSLTSGNSLSTQKFI